MKALEEKILKEGTVLPGHVLNVASFLNHRLDVDFIMEMGKEIARLFEKEKVTKILTVEASGIAVAMGAAAAMHVPVIFAKKHRTRNLSGEVYQTVVHSYTHGVDYHIAVKSEFLNQDDRILVVDDFLANGKALCGLIEIVGMAGARLAGCACAIEKGFQQGGDALRAKGVRVESLAIVETMSEDSLTFRRM